MRRDDVGLEREPIRRRVVVVGHLLEAEFHERIVGTHHHIEVRIAPHDDADVGCLGWVTITGRLAFERLDQGLDLVVHASPSQFMTET